MYIISIEFKIPRTNKTDPTSRFLINNQSRFTRNYYLALALVLRILLFHARFYTDFSISVIIHHRPSKWIKKKFMSTSRRV